MIRRSPIPGDSDRHSYANPAIGEATMSDGDHAHYVYPKKGVCDFCDGTNVRIRVEEETKVPDGKGGHRPAHICAACDG